ncbi:MAG: hypothetical protein BWY79_02001 [Actinobacteria bacterium ADurb.Bin444]|nr:MAG: hypothetical protein BWY79_02001 [Actinobacteria bacterium ADurb.Bin444]
MSLSTSSTPAYLVRDSNGHIHSRTYFAVVRPLSFAFQRLDQTRLRCLLPAEPLPADRHYVLNWSQWNLKSLPPSSLSIRRRPADLRLPSGLKLPPPYATPGSDSITPSQPTVAMPWSWLPQPGEVNTKCSYTSEETALPTRWPTGCSKYPPHGGRRWLHCPGAVGGISPRRSAYAAESKPPSTDSGEGDGPESTSPTLGSWGSTNSPRNVRSSTWPTQAWGAT